MTLHQKGQTAYDECMMNLTKKACEWIEIDFENDYLKAVKHYCTTDQERAN